MRITLIGGLDRAAPHYVRMAEALGHELSCHDGKMTQHGVRSLERLIEESDLVIVVTDINSHGAIQFARRRLNERGKTPLLTRKLGIGR